MDIFEAHIKTYKTIAVIGVVFLNWLLFIAAIFGLSTAYNNTNNGFFIKIGYVFEYYLYLISIYGAYYILNTWGIISLLKYKIAVYRLKKSEVKI